MKKKMLIIFLISGLIVGCSTNSNSKEHVIAENKKAVGVGIRLDIEADRLTNYKYESNNNEIIANIFLDNQFPYENDYKFYILVDYEISSFEYKGEINKHVKKRISPNSFEEFTIKLDDLEPGVHDIVLIVIRNSDNYIQEPKYINPKIQFFTKRVKVKISSSEANNNINVEEIQLEENKNNINFPGLYFTEDLFEEPSKLVTYTEVINNKKSLYINSIINNGDDTSFVLIVVLNDEIIFKKIYKAINYGLLSLPVNIENLKQGNNELYAILAKNPFDMSSVEKNLSIRISNRININYKVK
jgi:hypothetical protein